MIGDTLTKLAAAGAAVVLLVAGCGGADRADEPSDASLDVVTTTATVHGRSTDTAREFLGIRYAQPPTGDRRWAPPQPLPASSADADATEAGSQCPQNATVPGAAPSTDEDCLFLNVTTPWQSSSEPLPVMVFWHGGGYTSGAGSQYDAQRMASEGNVIVVTANYRLGMLGYLGLPGLDGSGDFGFADQIQSLKWVNENAEAFGGDPNNVTVFGQSAGGLSTCALLTSPAALGLVDKAAIMSGSCAEHWPNGGLYPGVPEQSGYASLADNEALGTDVTGQLGCAGPDAIDCLRRLPVESLVANGDSFSNELAYGTELLPTDPAQAVRDGSALQIPVIAGGTRNEHRSFVAGALLADPASITEQTYPALLAGAFGPDAQRVAEVYPLQSFPSAALAWSAVITDSAWSCTTTRNARTLAAGAPVYTYEFADTGTPDVNGVASSGVPQDAAHATDMPYLFDLGGQDLLKSPEQHELAHTMIGYLTSFAHNGTPTADGGPDWPRTTESDSPVLRFQSAGSEVVDADADHHCDFWNQLTP